MKKLLFVLAIGAFAACGSGDSSTTTGDTTTVTPMDTTTTTVTPMDTASKMVDSAASKMDTTTKK